MSRARFSSEKKKERKGRGEREVVGSDSQKKTKKYLGYTNLPFVSLRLKMIHAHGVSISIGISKVG